MKVTKHKIYFFLLVINLLICPAATFSQSEHPYIRIFEKASDEFNVPKPLLMALGWGESHWSMRYGQPTIDHAYGIMGLCSREDFDSLAQAANLIGLAPDMLKYDPESNIRGAAALLRHLANEIIHEGFPSPDKRVETWENVLIRYRGFKNYYVGLNYIYQIFYYLNFGVKAETDGGEAIYIPKMSLNFKWYRDKQQKVVRGLSAIKGDVDYSDAIWVPANSNNYTTANRDQDYPIKYIIIHVTEGSYSGAISWFQNSSAKVSAHYVIRSSDGEITQMVRHKDIAWHAGNWDYNTKSIGIEHEGYINNSSYFTEEMYKASASLTRYICDFYNIPKDRSHIIGHNEVPGATHTDPGSYWNWNHYMELVSNNVTITHTLTTPSKTTVSQGGILGPFTVEESNNGSSYYSYYVQPYVTKPEGTTLNFKKISTGLKAGETRTFKGYLYIPASSELGTFTFGVKITDTAGNLIDDDSFEFTVVSGSSSSIVSRRSTRTLKRLMRKPDVQTLEEDGWNTVIVPE